MGSSRRSVHRVRAAVGGGGKRPHQSQVLEPLGPTPELAFAYGALCTAHMLACELSLAAEWGDRAIDLSEQLGRADHLGYALIQSGAALLIAGQDAGLGRLHRGIDMARQSGLDDRVALGLSQIGSGAGEIRRYDLAVPALQEALSWARDHELTSNVVYVTAWLGRCELEQGRWDEAESRLTDLVPRCGGIARFVALTALGRLHARRGATGVWELLDEALEIAHRTGHLQRLWPIAAARAEAAWHAGRIGDEVDLVEQAHSLAVQLDYPWAISELDFWLWKAGLLPTTLLPAARLPTALLPTALLPTATEVVPEVALAQADGSDVDGLRAAFEALDRLRAEPLLGMLATRLKALGERVPRRLGAAARANPGGLTVREGEVAELVAAGLTDAEIAGRLFVSAKTVGHHVSSVLAKLGISSRRDVEPAVHRNAVHKEE